MRISELSRSTGVSVPTVKYYLREGLLPAGRPTAATQADYDDTHVARLRLIRALVDVGGLSLAAVRSVLAAIGAGPEHVTDAVSAAHSALSPVTATRVDGDGAGDDDRAIDPGGRRARDLVAELGWSVEPDAPALRQLGAALTALEDVGMTPTRERLRTYADAALAVATADVSEVPTGSGADAAAFVVLGTVLYEPVLLALRRLAQAHAYTARPAHRANPADPADPADR